MKQPQEPQLTVIERKLDRVLHHSRGRLGPSGLAPTEALGNRRSEATPGLSLSTSSPFLETALGFAPLASDGHIMRAADVRLLAIPGSLRRDSYNKSLLHAAAQVAPSGTSVLVYDALGEVPLFNEDAASGSTPPPGVSKLRRALSRCDGVLIATPEYNQAVPGVVKNMIDWLSLGEPHEGLEGRPIAVTGVTPGPWGTRIAQTMLRQMLVSTQAIVLPQPSLYLSDAESLFDDTGNLTDSETRQRLADLVSSLAQWVRLLMGQTAPREHQGLSVEAEASSLVTT